MNLIRCEHCGTLTVRRGASLAGAKCSSCTRPLLAPGLGEDAVRNRLYNPPRYVQRVDRAPLPEPVPLRAGAGSRRAA